MIYLSPKDYHRFHFPVTGYAAQATCIKGIYESVHPVIYTLGIQPLIENERHCIMLYPEQRQSPIVFIPIGALFVGAIHETYTPNTLCKKGNEMGYFAFGGSTIVMLFKKNAITLDEKLATAQKFVPIKMGERIARFNHIKYDSLD